MSGHTVSVWRPIHSGRGAFYFIYQQIKSNESYILEVFEKYLIEEEGCLIWTGKKRSNGSSSFPVIIFGPYFKYGKMVAQVMWCYSYRRDLPSDHVVMRTCSNSLCCAPDHLIAVPKASSMKFARIKTAGLLVDGIVLKGECFVTPKLDKWYDYYLRKGYINVSRG